MGFYFSISPSHRPFPSLRQSSSFARIIIVVHNVNGGGWARTIAEVMHKASGPGCALDAEGVKRFLLRREPSGLTCVEGIAALPPGCALCGGDGVLTVEQLPLLTPPPQPLLALLQSAVRRSIREETVAVALSGGLDSALVLALLKAAGSTPICYILSTPFHGYDETLAAQQTAKHFGAEAVVVQASAEDFITALPETIRLVERPLYNLHPVSKLLLARALQRDGVRQIFTGDGADQVFSLVSAEEYLPLAGAIFRGYGLALASPFIDWLVVAWARGGAVDPGKTALRELAADLVPRCVAERPKQARLAPALDISRYWDPAFFDTLRNVTGCPEPAGDCERTLWTTMMILAKELDCRRLGKGLCDGEMEK